MPSTSEYYALTGLYTVARNSSGTAYNASGAEIELANNVPRLTCDRVSLASLGLLIEGEATNAVRNPRMEGSVSGTPGTTPSTTAFPGNGVLGLSRTVTANGDGTCDVRYFGTMSAAGSLYFSPETQNYTAAPGQTWTISWDIALVAGAIPAGSTSRMFIYGIDSNGAAVDNTNVTFPMTGIGTDARRLYTRTISHPAAVAVRGLFGVLGTMAGTAVDFTLRFGRAQLEQSEYPTSYVLPPAGSPGVSIRLADQINVTDLARMAWSNAGNTLVFGGRLEILPAAGAQRGLWRADDGTDANVWRAYVASDGSVIVAVTIDGITTAVTAGTIGARTDFDLSATFGAGVLRASLNGAAAVVAAPTGMPANLARLRLGVAGVGSAVTASGTVRRFGGFPGTTTAAALPTIGI